MGQKGLGLSGRYRLGGNKLREKPGANCRTIQNSPQAKKLGNVDYKTFIQRTVVRPSSILAENRQTVNLAIIFVCLSPPILVSVPR
jgi:hypothetical protein